jgi:calcineurin-like phosphoesterase family protein
MIDYTGKKVLVVSDTHISHRNIIRYTGRPVDCDEKMFRAFAQRRDAEHIIHVGDFCVFYRVTEEEARAWYDRMFLNIHPTLIKGNHDKSKTLGLPWEKIVEEDIQPFMIEYEGLKIGFKHRPYQDQNGNLVLNDVGAQIQIHGHIHEKGQRFSWVGSSGRGALNVNACVEHWSYAPFDLDEVVQEYYARQQYERDDRKRRRGRR